MSEQHCGTPLPYERFVDYWFGDLPPAEQDDLELHILSCKRCGSLAESWALEATALAEGARPLPAAYLTPEGLAALGERAVVIDLPPEPEMSVRLAMGKIHVFRVSVDPKLARELERLDVEYLKEGHEDPIFHADDVTLTDSGKVHLACHSHVLSSHGDSTVRLIGTRGGERFTVFETLVHFT